MIYNNISELPKSDVEIIEEQIIKRLQKTLPFFDCEQCPVSLRVEDGYSHTYEEGIFLVRWLSTNFEKVSDYMQKGNHVFEVVTLMKSHIDNTDVYKILNAVQKQLCTFAFCIRSTHCVI